MAEPAMLSPNAASVPELDRSSGCIASKSGWRTNEKPAPFTKIVKSALPTPFVAHFERMRATSAKHLAQQSRRFIFRNDFLADQ